MNTAWRYRSGRFGFTLIELMAVIAIIGILAGVILGISGYVSRQADISRVKAELEKIKVALEEYKVVNGRFPPDLTNSAVIAKLTNYVGDLRFSDPWTRGYIYSTSDNNQFVLKSIGPNGVANDADDIESTKSAF